LPDVLLLFAKKGNIRPGKVCGLSCLLAPERVFDDLETMQGWGNRAYSVALRSARKKLSHIVRV
jgi:hypothetical protein